MELQEALLKRRSVRRYTEEPVSRDMIDKLLHAAMSGPSACNCMPWEFYAVTDGAALERLRHVTPYTNMNAPLAIVVCGNLSRAMKGIPSAFWVQDCSAATENILLAAVDMGLGSVWCGVHPNKEIEERVRTALNLSDNEVPLNIIFIGHGAESPAPRDQYSEEYVHFI